MTTYAADQATTRHNTAAEWSMERATGIEPVSLAWKAKVLPLHNARALIVDICPASAPLQDLFSTDHHLSRHIFAQICP